MNFVFSTSIDRLAFLGRFVLSLLILSVAGLLFHLFSSRMETSVGDMAAPLAIASLPAVPGLYYFMQFTVMARLRSIGLPTGYGLFACCPFLVLIIQGLKTAQFLLWADLGLWNYFIYLLALLFLLFFFVLFMA